MKKILMTLLCFVGLTGLAGMQEFDKTKFGFAEGFEGGTLNQEALVLQITAGNQLAYFKQGEKRPDGKIISQEEEGFYAGFRMGWNYTTWAYANVENDARFEVSADNGSWSAWYTGTEVQNGAVPGLSVATAGTAVNKYVTSFTYWVKIDPTALVVDKTYSRRLKVMSHDNIFDHYWKETEFAIQVLVSKDFTLKKPDGEQVFPAQTKLFEKLVDGHVAQYENMSYCGNVQKAYEKAIADAESRAKVAQQSDPYAKPIVEAFIKMESDGELDPTKAIAPKYGKIIFNLNGHHLSLLKPLPNVGCVYEFRDSDGNGTVDSKAEGSYMLANYEGNDSSSALIIHGGSYACLPFGPDGSPTVKIFNATIKGPEYVKAMRERGEGLFAARQNDKLTQIATDDPNFTYITYTTHVHAWKMWTAQDVEKVFKGTVDTNCVVMSCSAGGECPLVQLRGQDFFILHVSQADNSFDHQYPFNIRYFNGEVMPMDVHEDAELACAIRGKGVEVYMPFFRELNESAGDRGYATSVSTHAGVYANDEVQNEMAGGDLFGLYAKLSETLAGYNDEQYKNVFCNGIGGDFGSNISKAKARLTDLDRLVRQTTDDVERAKFKEEIGAVQKEHDELQEVFAESISKAKNDPPTYMKYITARYEFAMKEKGRELEIQKMKQELRDARGGYYEVYNAPIYNPGRYDIYGDLYINDYTSSEPNEGHFGMHNDAEILPLPLMGQNGSGAFHKDEAFRLNPVLSPGETPVPYTGGVYEPWVEKFEYLVNGRLANDYIPDAGIYQENFMGNSRADWYALRGLTVLYGDAGQNPGVYTLGLQANHTYNVEMARQGVSVRPNNGWCDPFFGINEGLCAWKIEDAPVMVRVTNEEEGDIRPFLTLTEALAALEDDPFYARLTAPYSIKEEGTLTVPKNYGFLDLGKCAAFCLDLGGWTLDGNADPESPAIVNEGVLYVKDSGRSEEEKNDKKIVHGVVNGAIQNNGTMWLANSVPAGKTLMATEFNGPIQNNGTMYIYGGTFNCGPNDFFVNGRLDIYQGVFNCFIAGTLNGNLAIHGGEGTILFSKKCYDEGTIGGLLPYLTPGYQFEDIGEYWQVVPHKHVYELTSTATGFTLTCTNEPICMARSGEFWLKDPKEVNHEYNREPLDAAPYGCWLADDLGATNEVTLAEFVKAFPDVLAITKPFDYAAKKPVDAGKYEAGIEFVASNVMVKGELTKEEAFSCGTAYVIDPVELTSVTLNKSTFDYDGELHNVAEYRGSIYAGSLLIDAEFNFGKDCVIEAVGSPFGDCTYPFIVDGMSPNTYGSVTNYWTIYAPSGTFAEKAAAEAMNGNAPCGSVTGNPKEGYMLFVTDTTNMVYDAESRTWFAGLTVTWPYKTALLSANREYTPAEDAYFLSSTDPTNLVTAADIQGGVNPEGTLMAVSVGKDGISDVPGVKQFTWWVRISEDDAAKARAAYYAVQDEDGAYDKLEKMGDAIAQQLVNAQAICEFIAEGLEKEVLWLIKQSQMDKAVAEINKVRQIVNAEPLTAITPEVVSNHMAAVTAYADYIATGDEALYAEMIKLWVEAFGKDALQPVKQKAVAKFLNEWAKFEFEDFEGKQMLKLPEGTGYAYDIMPECARNLYIVKNYEYVTYTLTAWGLAGSHSPHGVMATDFKVIIPSENFELVEDDLKNAVVVLEGGEGFDAKSATYKFDRKEHFVTVPETIQLGVNTLKKGVDFKVTGEGEDFAQKGVPYVDCYLPVTLTPIEGRGIKGFKMLLWGIKAPTGNFGEVTIANDAKAGKTEGDKMGLTFTFKDDTPNAGLQYYTEDEATAAGLAAAGWYAAVKVVVPADIDDFLKPTLLYFSANGGKEFNANDCKDAINGFGVKSEVTEDISTMWYPCVRSFTWWTRIDEDDVAKAIKDGNTAITNEISAYGLAWSETKNLVTFGSAGIRQQEFRVVIDIEKIELIDADDIQHWPQHDHDYMYELTDGTNLTATCMNTPCRQGSLTLTLVGPADKVYDGTASVATLEGDKAFLFYTGSKHGPIMYYNEKGFSNEAAPVNAGTYTAKLGVDCALFPSGTDTKTLSYQFTIAAQTTEPGEITAVLNKDTFNYTGSELKPTVTVAYNGKTLKSGVDYTLSGDLAGVGSGAEDTVYEITVSNAVNYAFEPITLNWTVKAPTGSFTDVAKASDAIGGELEDNTLSFEPVDEKGTEVLNSGLVYFTAEEAQAANAGDTAGWYAGLTVKLPVDTWTFTTPEHLLFTYYGKQILGSACPYQTEDGLRLTLDTGVTAGGIGNYRYVNSFTWWERIDLEEIEAAREPFIHYPEVATNLTELAKATTYLGAVALPKSAGWYVTHGDLATAKKYCEEIMCACGGNPLESVSAQTVTNLCELLTGYADYLATEDEGWYNTYSNFMVEVGKVMPDQVQDPQYAFAKIPGLVAAENHFENKEDGGVVAPLVTEFDEAKLDKDCATILMADTCLFIAEMAEMNVITRSLTAAATTWSGKVIGIDTYGDANGIAEQTFLMEVDVNELSTFWDNEGHRFYPPHDHAYVFSMEKGVTTNLIAQCTKRAEGCPYPVMQLYLPTPSKNIVYGYDGRTHEAELTATVFDLKTKTSRSVPVAKFMDYTASSTPDGFIYKDVVTGVCTNVAPTMPGHYTVSIDVVSVTNKEENLSVTNTLSTSFSITKVWAGWLGVDLGTTSFMWDGKDHSVSIRGVYNGYNSELELVEGVDYAIDYEHSVFSAVGEEGEDLSYPVVITGCVDSCYYGATTNWWNITTGEGWYVDAISGEKTYGSDLEDIFNRASVKDPIDVNLGKSYSTYGVVDVDADLFGRTKLFDLRGKTVTHEQMNGDSSAPYIRNDGVLTITDSVGGGMLSNVNAAALLIDNRKTLTIEKGTFVGKIKNTGKLTIADGTFTGDLVSGESGLAEEILRASTTALEISGGTFTGDLTVHAGKATITGGTFTGSISKDLLTTIEISGGKFSADVPESYLKAGYVAEKNPDDGYWYVTKHTHAYTFQQVRSDDQDISVKLSEGAVLLGECFTNATKRIACDERVIKAELVATDQEFTGSPYSATLAFSVKDSVLSTTWKTLTLAQYVEYTGAVISNIVYSKNGEKMDWEEVVMPGAGYKAEVTIVVTNTAAITGAKEEKTFTLTKSFKIDSAPFADVEVVTTPDVADELIYTGEDISIDVKAYFNAGGRRAYELTEGEDFYLSGVTSTNAIGEFTFTLEPDGANFVGEPKSFTWKIVEPNGSFAADAMSAAVADGAPAYGEVVEGTNLVITASTNLWYDTEAKCWFAGFEIAWPYDIEQVLRAPTYTDLDHALVKLSTEEELISLTDVATGKVEAAGLDASSDQFWRIKNNRYETYVKGVEWIVPFTFDMITNALAQGETELSYTISVMSPAWENNPHGLKATTYKITLPLDENLVLWDDQGRQLFPVHVHDWACELFADDGVVTNRLTATCLAADCPQGSLTVVLGAEAGTDKEYDGQPLEVAFVGAEEFAIHTGAEFGQVCYETEDGIAVNGVPVDAGVYFAKATVTMPDESVYALKLKLAIGERDLHRGYIELTGGSEYHYTGNLIDVDEDAMTVHYLGQTLVRDQDYTVDAESVFTATGSGISNMTYKITVEGLGNYTNVLSYFWTIYAPTGDFGAAEKAAEFKGGEFADATTLVLTNANEVNYGLAYYTADNAPDGSGIAGWYAGIKVDLPHETFEYTPASKLLFNDVDRDESFTGAACPYDGVSVAISQVIYKYVTSFTWWTRVTLDDVIAAEGADIVRTLKATGIAWKDGVYGSYGLAEQTYQIVVKTENIVLFDDRGVQLYPHHDHSWFYEIGEDAIRATCLAEECPVMACELHFEPIVHEQALNTTAADSAELLGAETFALHVGAEIGEFRFFDLEGAEIDPPSLVGEYLATVDVALPLTEGGVLTNTLSTAVSVVKTEGATFDANALEPYDFKDGNEGGYGTVVDRTSVVVTDSKKLAYDPATTTWFAGVFVKMPNGYYGGDLFANQIKDETTFLSVSTAEGFYYADKVAAGEALADELLEIKDEHSTGIFFPGVDYLYSIGWKIPLTIRDVETARAAGETEIVRTITIGANSRAQSQDPLDWGSSEGVVPTTFTLVIPLEGLVLVNENGEEVWPLRYEPSGVVTYPKANASTGLVKVNTTATWKAKPNANSVFGHWEWISTNAVPANFAALSENEKKSPTLKVKPLVGELVRPTDFAAVWYRIDEDLLGEVTLTPSNLVTESKSYVTATVSGLPTGLKFNKKSLALTGMAKKAQSKTVKITVKNGSGYTLTQSYTLTVYGDLTASLSPIGEPVRTGAAVLAWGDSSLGTTKGAKVYLTKSSTQKVSLKATPVKGAIFLGWYDDPAFTIPAKWLPKGYLTASQTVQAPAGGFELFARFVKLETWTVGTFDGIYLVPGEEDDVPQGKVTVTVSSTGKVSGKTTVMGKSYSFSAVAFDDCLEEGGELCFTAHAVEKTTGRRLAIFVSCDEATGLGNAIVEYGDSEDSPWATAVQNGWKLKPAVLPAFLTGSSAITLAKDGISFKFGAKGVVKVTGKVNGASVSQSAQLLPATIDAELDGGPVTITAYVYLATAPKSGLPNGFYAYYPVTLTVTNGTVTKIEFVEEEE